AHICTWFISICQTSAHIDWLPQTEAHFSHFGKIAHFGEYFDTILLRTRVRIINIYHACIKIKKINFI
ncbi:MAG: hypothetical protein ACKPKO_49435, partial [Candidatus Fonsibacter sp.]